MTGMPFITSSFTTTLNSRSARNSTILCSSPPELPGPPTGDFQASVSGSIRASDHLSAGEQLMPHTCQAEPDRKTQGNHIRCRIAQLTMQHIEVFLT